MALPPRKRARRTSIIVSFLLALSVVLSPHGSTPASPTPLQADAERDRGIAVAFAPNFYQGLGDTPRFDYITNFDFDGDWKGDNNWKNSESQTFPLKAYVYYAVSETPTHFFVHYAAFHPRDYKGGAKKGAIFSELIREGVRLGGRFDPTGWSQEAVLAHENDLEGCLVTAEKNGDSPNRAKVVCVETLAHNNFLKYVPEYSTDRRFETIPVENNHPSVFVEPKGHGIQGYRGEGKQLRKSVNGVMEYHYAGRAEDPDQVRGEMIGYELLPISTTLWARAREGENDTYGLTQDFGTLAFTALKLGLRARQRSVTLGTIGTAFRGTVGAPNMARPPWGWFDVKEESIPPGQWFFDPAQTIKRHFDFGDGFSTVYLHNLFLGMQQ